MSAAIALGREGRLVLPVVPLSHESCLHPPAVPCAHCQVLQRPQSHQSARGQQHCPAAAASPPGCFPRTRVSPAPAVPRRHAHLDRSAVRLMRHRAAHWGLAAAAPAAAGCGAAPLPQSGKCSPCPPSCACAPRPPRTPLDLLGLQDAASEERAGPSALLAAGPSSPCGTEPARHECVSESGGPCARPGPRAGACCPYYSSTTKHW